MLDLSNLNGAAMARRVVVVQRDVADAADRERGAGLGFGRPLTRS